MQYQFLLFVVHYIHCIKHIQMKHISKLKASGSVLNDCTGEHWTLGKWKCWHTVGPHIQYSEKKSSRDKRGTVVGEELSSCGMDGNEASSRVGPAGRGSMAHRGFSVHCNPERGGGPWAGLSSSLPLGKWSTFL